MEIENLITNYQPSDFGVSVIQKTKIAFLVGILASGKDTLQEKLIALGDYSTVITYTTRPKRVNNGLVEQDGVEYRFVSISQMEDLLKSHQIIEANNFLGDYYATSVREFECIARQNKIALCSVDVNGVDSFKKIPQNDVTAIFVVPPDYETWIDRAINRYGSRESFMEVWHMRREFSILELERALNEPFYKFVVNDELNDTTRLIDNIIHNNLVDVKKIDIDARRVAQDFLAKIKNGI